MKFFTATFALFAAVAFAAPHTGHDHSDGPAATAPPTQAATAPAAVPTASSGPVSGASNAFTFPLGDKPIEAGKQITIKWQANYGDKVTLTLRKGEDTNNLDSLVDIAKDIDNSGSFTWTPPKDLAPGSDYAIQIVSGNAENYSPQFKVDSSGKGLATTKSAASASSTASKTDSETDSASASKTDSASESATATASETSSESESASATSSSASPTSTSSSANAAAPDDSDSGVGQIRSPLALVVCVVAAVAYFH